MVNRRDRINRTNPLQKPRGTVPTLAELNDAMVRPDEERDESTQGIIAQTGLTINETGFLTIGGYQLTHLGLMQVGEVSHDDWERTGLLLFRLEGAIQMLIGDWLVQAERVWGTTYQQIAEATGREVTTLYNYKWVAESVDFSLRSEKLTYSHYYLVAGLAPDRKHDLLQRAIAENWSVARLRLAALDRKPAQLPMPHSSTELTSRSHKMAFNRVWRALNQTDGELRREDLEHLQHWLDEVKSKLQ